MKKIFEIMKKRNRSRRLARQGISLLLIFLIILDLIPVPETNVLDDLLSLSLRARAEGTNSEFPHDENLIVHVPIDRFVDYSKEFSNADLAAYHQYDIIIIDPKSGSQHDLSIEFIDDEEAVSETEKIEDSEEEIESEQESEVMPEDEQSSEVSSEEMNSETETDSETIEEDSEVASESEETSEENPEETSEENSENSEEPEMSSEYPEYPSEEIAEYNSESYDVVDAVGITKWSSASNNAKAGTLDEGESTDIFEESESEDHEEEYESEESSVMPDAEDENGTETDEETNGEDVATSEENSEYSDEKETNSEIRNKTGLIPDDEWDVNLGDGDDTNSNIDLIGFEGLGTAASPFGGEIRLSSNFNASFNLDRPLFNYVYDTVIINNGNAISISRKYYSEATSKTTPLLATEVIHHGNGGARWVINVVPNKVQMDNIVLADFGGFFGKINNNVLLYVAASLTVDGMETGTTDIGMHGDNGIGLICNEIQNDVMLDFTLSGDRNITEVTTPNGNAGGLAGTIGSGSTLEYTQIGRSTSFLKSDAVIRTTYGDYAGGIAGKVDGGKVIVNMPSGSVLSVSQTISAITGTGGIFGFYKPMAPGQGETTVDIDLTQYSINCTVNGDGSCGGIIGEMKTAYPVNITGDSLDGTTVQSEHESGSGDDSLYGGLIGKYRAYLSSDAQANTDDSTVTLYIKDVITEMSKAEGGILYAGGIAQVEGASYVKFEDFELNGADNTNKLTFGGLVARAEKAFVDAKNVKIATTDGATIKGGGLVGDIGDGVLRMAGNIDLSDAKSSLPAAEGTEEVYVGQIVGHRDDALIFAEQGCALARSAAVEVDDIGTWGEFLRFDGTSLNLTTTTESMASNAVLTINETTHQITIAAPSLTIGSTADFAKVALCMQLDTTATGNPFVTVSGSYTYATINTANISLANTIDENGLNLAGTGLTGFTRDNSDLAVNTTSTPKYVYKGTFDGNDKILKLAIGDSSSGFNGNIYRHRYNGLFSSMDGGTIQNITLAGTVNVKDSSSYKAGDTTYDMYIGAASARSTNNFTASDVTVNTVFNISNGTKCYKLKCGRLLGSATDWSTTITVKDCDFEGNVNASCSVDESLFGGVIGSVDQSGAFSAGFTNVVTGGAIINGAGKSNQRLGGLIAEICDSSSTNGNESRVITLTNVSPKNLTIEGNIVYNKDAENAVGGALGYKWLNTNVNIISVTVGDENKKVEVKSTSGNGNLAGLVYRATGHWVIGNGNSLTFNNFKATAGSASSFGMIVNKGRNSTKGLFLDLQSGFTYTISSSTDLSGLTAGVFDELVAYSSDGNVMTNNQGIVSIHTTASTIGGVVMDGSSSSLTYQAQTAKGATANPNTRYYYNLDTVTGKDASSSAFSGTNANQNKLMSWALRWYAADNLKQYFYNAFAENTVGAADVNYDMRGYSWYPVSSASVLTVNGNFTFYNEEFEGSEDANPGRETGLDYYRTSHKTSNTYTQHRMMQNGLFYNVTNHMTIGNVKLAGNVGVAESGGGSGALISGSLKGSANSIPKFTVTTSLILDGIKVYNLIANPSYAPLLINKVETFVEFKPSHIWADGSKYTIFDSQTQDPVSTNQVATSLIGYVGSSSAEQLRVEFSDIRLDGRGAEATEDLYSVYGTKQSIFTHSTLLESFAFKDNSGSYGVYRFTEAEDWTGNAHTGHVTYGSEISDGTSRKEYYGKEFRYSGDTPNFVHPTSTIPASVYSFTKYLPYVNQVYGGTYHQLEVNHTEATFDGCGTYNHPYQITSAGDLEIISKIMNGQNPTNGYVIKMDADSDKWCPSKRGHEEYKFQNGQFEEVGGSKTKSVADVATYLANAYYEITGKNIELTNSNQFLGLGNNSSSDKVFRGVINGLGNTIENNTTNPLIYSSNGCVVYNLTVEVDNALTYDQTTSNAFSSSGGCNAYGAIIGRVFGGDNIIDNVKVTYGNSASFNFTGDYGHLVPVGGYIGVVLKGAVYFRGFEDLRSKDVISGLAQLEDSAITNKGNPTTMKIGDKTYAAYKSENTKWLYINPIIGRVVNGFAITETDIYRPFESGTRKYPSGETITDNQPVTMQNGTKNYSIADINQDAAIMEMNGGAIGSTVTLKNAQSLYIVSLLAGSGISTSNNGTYENTYNFLQPYNEYMSTHMANYHYVGDASLNGSTPPSESSENLTPEEKDYISATKDVYGSAYASKIPYIIEKYTPKVNDVYPAFNFAGYTNQTINNNRTELYLNMELSGDEMIYYMPDGFRGLGALLLGYGSSTNWIKESKKRVYHAMNISCFDGNNKTISLNMNLLLYNADNYHMPNAAQAYMKTGFGFFNVLRSNYDASTSPNAKIKDFTIKGNVKYDLLNQSTGSHVAYTSTSLNRPAVGAVVGAPGADTDDGGGGSIYLDNISLNDVSVYSARDAGGFYGCTNSEQKYYIMNCSADNLEIFGAMSTGGLIGYIRNGKTKLDVDFGTKEFKIISIRAGGTVDGANNGNDDKVSAGGLFGENYVDTSGYVNVKNAKIKAASSVSKGYIGYDDKDCKNNQKPDAGGIVGKVTRNGSMKIENCSVTDIDIVAVKTGGIAGYITGKSPMEIKNSTITTSKECVIKNIYNNSSNAASGGFIGNSNITDASYNIKIMNSRLSGYTVAGYYSVGGVIGKTSGGNLYKVICDDLTVESVKINGTNDVGGLIGNHTDATLSGYNIEMYDLSFAGYEGTGAPSSNCGYIIGKKSTSTNRTVKIAGFSRQEKPNTTIPVGKMVGNFGDTASNRYGSAGYVVFADYTGTSVLSGKNTIQSSVKKTDTSSPYTNVSIPQNSVAYVTVNPVKYIDSVNILTSDGIDNTSFAGIRNDSKKKKYSEAKAAIGDSAYEAAMNNIYSSLSTSQAEFGTTSIPNFPLLVIEDTNPNNTSALINNYLRILTNTGFSFDNDMDPSVNATGYVYDVDLIKMTYNSSSPTKFVAQTGEACLKRINQQFCMNVGDVDSGETPQFSLIDIKFYDPDNIPKYNSSNVRTTNGIVAYHLYVPVYVKKIRRFDFSIKIDSGTDYSASHFNNVAKGGTLFENFGNPVTVEFEYNYLRSPAEWVEAINSGEITTTNYYKRLLIKSHIANHKWPDGTKFVLVDASKDDKYYYMDNPNSKITFASDGIGYLDLWDFVDENTIVSDSGEEVEYAHYAPVNFCDLFENVQMQQDNDGPLTTSGATDSNADFSDGTTNYRFVSKVSGTVDANTRYRVSSIGSVRNEKYYLSVFIPKLSEQRIYRYEISSVDANVRTATDKWDIPVEKWSSNKVRNNSTVNLFTGNLYTNSLNRLQTDTKDHTKLMGDENKYITVSMESTIALTQAAITANIKDNLRTSTNARIYQSFLVSLDMLETPGGNSVTGIKETPTKALLNRYYYKASGQTEWSPVISDDKKVVDNTDPGGSNSFIELRSGKDLREILGTAGVNSVDLKVDYDLVYQPTQISGQFPKGIFNGSEVENGTKVVGYSNVGSSLESVSYSANTSRLREEYFYYTSDISSADLSYYVDEKPYRDYGDEDNPNFNSSYTVKAGPYSMIGINPVEEDTNMYVATHAVYDVSEVESNAQYVRIAISLQKRAGTTNPYDTNLELSHYFTYLAIWGKNGSGEVVALNTGSVSGTEYVITVPRSSLQLVPDHENQYYVPITFVVKSGSGFEADTLEYSNYKVKLKMDLRDTDSSASAVDNSADEDHIIYTNAKVQPKVIQ